MKMVYNNGRIGGDVMSFNYYHTNFVIPNLILANKKFFIETILPNPNNMQIFIEKESYKLALKG